MNRIFAICSLCLLVTVALAGWRDSDREWKKYQREFYQLEARISPDAGAAGERLEIRQIVNEDLGIVDRCTTCHLGVEDPRFKNAPQPFRTHPNPDSHPFDKYGCTICHSGQGAATSSAEAHGWVKHWNHPILPGEFLQSACIKCHEGSSPFLGAAPRQGKKLFTERACIGCHKIDGRGGSIGPDLSAVGERRNADWLIKHFRNPRDVVPGSRMPKLRLADPDIKILTAFMLSRQKQRIPDEYLTVQKPVVSEKEMEPSGIPSVEIGRHAFRKYGCLMCHGKNGKGGVRNRNSKNKEVPALTFAAQGLFADEILQKILHGSIPEKADPKGEDPLYVMPAWHGIISDVEAKSLVAYVESLMPKGADKSW